MTGVRAAGSRPLRRLLGALGRLGVTLFGLYLVLWAVTWIAGDTSRLFYRDRVPYFPDVFLGGLPPSPQASTPPIALAFGAMVLAALVFDRTRGHRRSGGAGRVDVALLLVLALAVAGITWVGANAWTPADTDNVWSPPGLRPGA